MASAPLGRYAESGYNLASLYSDDFNFNDFKPPVYDLTTVGLMIAGYLIAIRLTTWFMATQEKPFKMKEVTAIHNLFLFLISVTMLFGVLYNVFVIVSKDGLDAVLVDADRSHRAGKLLFWVYIFYLTKPYEFVDTFIMIFKKRELNFLHVWHHCTTFLLVWLMQAHEMQIQWISVSANCLVHSFMYYYYFVATLGIQPWWKRYLTLLQIFQFIITTTFNLYWGYAYLQGYNPSGTVFGFWFGMFIINSFLVLFINFYMKSYKNPNSPAFNRAKKE